MYIYENQCMHDLQFFLFSKYSFNSLIAFIHPLISFGLIKIEFFEFRTSLRTVKSEAIIAFVGHVLKKF